MTQLGTKRFAVLWQVVLCCVLQVVFVLVVSGLGLVVGYQVFWRQEHSWLSVLLPLLLPLILTACVCCLARPAFQRHSGTLLMLLLTLVTSGISSTPWLGTGVALLLAGAVFVAFKLQHWWVAQTITLALGALTVGSEARAGYDAKVEPRDARAEAARICRAVGGAMVSHRDGMWFCDPTR